MLKKKTGEEIIINCESLETRAALMEEGRLQDLFVERPSDQRIVGNIYKGKIQNLEDGLQAAFVDIGLSKNAFIHYWDMIPEDTARLEAEEGLKINRGSRRKRFDPQEMNKRFPVGSEIIVQITKDAIGSKGPRVTVNLSLPGRYLVMMPGSSLKGVSRKISEDRERQRLKRVLARLPVPKDIGLIIRTAGEGARKTSFVRDVRQLIDTWREIEHGIRELPAPALLYREPGLAERVARDSLTENVDRIIIDSREVFEALRDRLGRFSRRARGKLKLYEGKAQIFDHFGVERQIANAFRRRVWLKSGGYIVIDETEAMVAVDVNTGRHKGGKTQEEVIVEVNMEAAEEIARQMRLRNIGGLVVIDFIDMRQKKHQAAVVRQLKQSLKRDKARTNVLPVSQLGLVEMTRQRVEESIGSAAFTDCPYCKGKGRVMSELSMSVAIQRHIADVLRRNGGGQELSLRIRVNKTILDRLRSQDEQVLIDLERNHGARLTFVEDNNLHIEEYEILEAAGGRVLYSSIEG